MTGKITKQEAKNALTDYLKYNDLPDSDRVILTYHKPPDAFTQFTFKGLLCVAYDLNEKQ